MKQALIVASFCEFGGAVLLGSGVTDTIKSGIAKVSAYTYEPELLMYGMVCALLATGLWLALATFLELPVSTTHSIVGAIIGMSLIAAGPDSVIWYSAPKPGSPFPGGFVSIVLAWFITPAMAMVLAALLFLFTKLVVLKAANPFRRSLLLFPFYTFITVWIVTYFVIQKGVNSWMKAKTYSKTSPIAENAQPSCPPAGAGGTVKSKTSGTDVTNSLSGCQIPDGTNAWISAVTATVVTLICIACLKFIIKLVERDLVAAEADDAAIEARHAGVVAGDVENGDAAKEAKTAEEVVAATDAVPRNRTPAMLQDMRKSKVWTSLTYGANYDIHESVADDEKIMAMHNEAELFDRKTELSFKYLQVLTACSNSFAHGANDVANAIGSMAAVYSIWQCACANSKANVPIWMFIIGGVGLVLGLATYGYKIMRALGVKMTKLTNSRGYCAELTSAIIVIVASRYGFPVSTTQVITGAITGIGVLEVISAKMRGEKNSANRFNFALLLKFFAGWVATLIVAGFTSAAFTAQGIYAPSRSQSGYQATLNKAYNATNVGMANTLIAAGNVTNPTPEQAAALAAGTSILNAVKLSWSANNATMLNADFYTNTFQQGTYALGNASVAGVLNGAFMPTMPDINSINLS